MMTMMNRVGFLIVMIWPHVTLAGPLSVDRLSVDEMTTQFEKVVFGSEFQGFTALSRVNKWRGPLRVEVRSYQEIRDVNGAGQTVLKLEQVGVEPRHLSHIQHNLNVLAGLTGLHTENVLQTGSPANFQIKIVPRSQLANPQLADVDPKLLRKLASQGGCYFLIWHDDTAGLIEKTVIVANSDRTNVRMAHCLLEEMTQSLGFPNDVDLPVPSIFSNNAQIVELTRADQILIKTLYNPALRPAMKRTDAVKLARTIIRELDRWMP